MRDPMRYTPPMRPALLLLAATAPAALSACSMSYTKATRLHDDPRPLFQRPATAVEIFAAAPPPHPYVETAVLQSEGSSSGSTLATLRDAAGHMGCDGLVVAPADRGSGIHHVSAWRGVCLVYPEAGP